MGHTLDELLDATGISELEAASLEKSAADTAGADDDEQLLKLAERCERAAAQPVEGPGAGKERELAEKTAAIAVIVKTLGEIAEIAAAGIGGGAKLASDQRREAAFIEHALAEGHTPDEIARFMKQAGLLQTMRKTLQRGGGVPPGM